MSREAGRPSHPGRGAPGEWHRGSMVIGVDLGATMAKVGLVTVEGEVVRRCSVRAEPERGPGVAVEHISRAASSLLNEAGLRVHDVLGVGVASPGAIDIDEGIVLFWPNVPRWREVPLRRMVEQRLGMPCALENDGNAAALAEHWVGAGRGLSSLVLLTLGTGIGGGVVLDGRIWRGSHGAAGELGHMTINAGGPACSCGGRGCLQAYASATAMVRRMREALAAGARSVLAERPDELTAEAIQRAAAAGDEAARENIRQTGRYLGVGVSNLLHLLNPQAVAFSGGVTGAGSMLMDPLREEVERRTLEASRRGVWIGFSAAPRDAGIIGAARRFITA